MTPAAHYPYSLLGKFVRYPWAKHWKQGRFYRYYAYSIIICLPLFHLIGKAGKYVSFSAALFYGEFIYC